MYPILFKFGPITIYAYGLIVAMAFAICAFLIWYNAPLVKMPREHVLNLVMVIIVSGIAGGRILHVILNLDYYKNFPLEIIMVTRGGLAFHGGLAFSIVGTLIFLKRNNIPIWSAGDLIAPYAALGQAIGRLGCFLNGCCFGKIADIGFLGVIFPLDTVYRHPTQIYSFLALFLIYLILRFLLQRNILRYNLLLVYFLLHAVQRFSIDFLRDDIPKVLFNLTISQLISIAMFSISALLFILRQRPKSR